MKKGLAMKVAGKFGNGSGGETGECLIRLLARKLKLEEKLRKEGGRTIWTFICWERRGDCLVINLARGVCKKSCFADEFGRRVGLVLPRVRQVMGQFTIKYPRL